jgi:hypothetical protein
VPKREKQKDPQSSRKAVEQARKAVGNMNKHEADPKAQKGQF